MTEVPSPDLRIGDNDRESALKALGEHLSAGRLDLDEYGDRSAKVTAARTRRDLAELFADLPAPHPVFEQPRQAKAVEKKPDRPPQWTERPTSQRVAAAAVPFLWVAAVSLSIVTGVWWWIALPFVFTAAASAFWGKDWERDRHGAYDRRDRRR
ncbi:DUF1707 SHOCT-like domain-containing protein [Amycolatopsis thermoflava]|uniref:Uncharacterized protein DUF1707 n=1 Tax=Amycolatopsis thermoflava TaxID=84480 RepID=A0A3N2GV90_9PSEU|nr:DUF1707 domain-containing protein [Amycolatopsis thermoflava]ROS40200.1 uncharacterized protein DUF1707 [Amycolatopsis thermoflava]